VENRVRRRPFFANRMKNNRLTNNKLVVEQKLFAVEQRPLDVFQDRLALLSVAEEGLERSVFRRSWRPAKGAGVEFGEDLGRLLAGGELFSNQVAGADVPLNGVACEQVERL
jgi:hypothetical protein